MTEQATEQYDTAPEQYNTASEPAPSSGSTPGLVIFAGIMMIMAGVFQAFAGLTALFEDEFFVASGNYVFKFDVTTWGWVHLLGGVVVALAGVSLMSGRTWARVIGIILAVLSAMANFTFIPYYPTWSLLIIALDVFVIWALATYRPDTRQL